MRVEEILATDRAWCAYALGDLEPGLREHCEWRIHGEALVLLFRGFETPVLFAHGEVGPLMAGLADPVCYLSVLPPVVEQVRAAGYGVEHEKLMWRMRLDPAAFHAAADAGVVRLTEPDVADLSLLYADGRASGESPDFFYPSMVAQGVFFGIRGADGWLAVAGTHLVSPLTSVAAIGNVYTRRDSRGRGLARRATAAVAGELLRLGISTVILNVAQSNAPAIRIYQSLGFVRHCEFREGVARRVTAR